MQGFGNSADNILNLLYSGNEENAKLAATIAEGLHIPMKKLIKAIGWDELGFSNTKDFHQKKVCYLQHCHLDSTELLSKAVVLQKLYLNNSQVNHLVGLENLYNLSYLNLTAVLSNNFSATPIANLTHFIADSFHVNVAKKIDFVVGMAKLTELSFAANGLGTTDFLSNLNQLKVAILGHNELKDIKGLQHATQLQHLNLNSNKLQTLDVSHLHQLKHLYADSNRLEELNIANCSLSVLSLAYCRLKSIDLTPHADIERLELANNQLQTFELKDKLSLSKLNLMANQLKELHLSNLPSLWELNLAYNPLEKVEFNNINKSLTVRLSRDMENGLIHKEIKKQLPKAKITF